VSCAGEVSSWIEVIEMLFARGRRPTMVSSPSTVIE